MDSLHAAIQVTIDRLNVIIVQPAKGCRIGFGLDYETGESFRVGSTLHFRFCYSKHADPFSHELTNVDASHTLNGKRSKKGQMNNTTSQGKAVESSTFR
jgi:hypothetical protein